MPRPPGRPDLFALIIDSLAEALAARLHGSSAGGPASSSPRASGRQKGEKRPPALLAKTTSELLGHIKSHPGERIEQIALGLGLSTQELKLPTLKLLAARKVKTKGQRRGTKYFAA